jgi:peptide methionine sulfoxide reductase MsrA
VIEELESAHVWARPIVTEVTRFTQFYKAEDYHQEYYKNNQRQPYCRAVITPKVTKFRKVYLEKLKI